MNEYTLYQIIVSLSGIEISILKKLVKDNENLSEIRFRPKTIEEESAISVLCKKGVASYVDSTGLLLFNGEFIKEFIDYHINGNSELVERVRYKYNFDGQKDKEIEERDKYIQYLLDTIKILEEEKTMKKVDIKTLDVPNVCFSLSDKDDEREKKYKKQRIERGFDDTELWNLDVTISKFILPRLIIFRQYKHDYPANLTEEKWYKILGKMIYAFEKCSEDGNIYDDEILKKIDKGLKLFAKYFQHL